MSLALEIGLHWKAFTVIYSYISAVFIVAYLHFIKPLNLETLIALWVIMGFAMFMMIKMGDLIFP